MKQRIAEAAAEDGDHSQSDSSSDGSDDEEVGRGHFTRRRVMRRPHYEGKTGGSLSAASPAMSTTTRSLVGGVQLPSTLVNGDDDDDDDDKRPEGKRGGSIGARRAIMQGRILLPSSLDDSDDSDDSDDPEDERIRSYGNRRIPSTRSAAASSAGGKTRK